MRKNLTILLGLTLMMILMSGCGKNSVGPAAPEIDATLMSMSGNPWRIKLPVDEITKLTYIGEEKFHDLNGNFAVDVGDYFEGALLITNISNVSGSIDYSDQLASRELTIHFRFTAISISPGHIDFGITEQDFLRAYVGKGKSKNYDGSALNLLDRVSDGKLWFDTSLPAFFESVNDRQSDGSTLNRAWMDFKKNRTGYNISKALLYTLLGKDANHTYLGVERGDIEAQLIFNNWVAGFSTNPNFTFNIFGDIYMFATDKGHGRVHH